MTSGYTVTFINSLTGRMYDWMYLNNFTSATFKSIENALMGKAAQSNEFRVIRAEIYANNGRGMNRTIHGITAVNGAEIRMKVVVGGQIIRTMIIAE